ncbi:LuxR C-terminal-related transcriptional regulator [Lentzea sp. NBRC 105346]|uniref:ATP-binding protein n=1 Tax=Lentzea sp. NBRC 105346 TaxID=3032205 RepID=UPI002552F56E|nr:LuxR C-terminal-related transcriptional regulator [Lentzea sp. NBRC 105346]
MGFGTENITVNCGACGAEVTLNDRGRPARYCSNACRQRAFRRRGGSTSRAGDQAIPEPLDSFVGREEEMAALRHLMRSARMVTVVGTAGVGKTRLALEVARRAVGGRKRKFRLVELGSVVDGTRILETIATALGVREAAGEPALRPVVDAINNRRLSLVVDNCEQLTVPCAVVLRELLERCPLLRVLATSREPLGVAGEALLHIEPLPVDGLASGASREQVLASPAVQLFLDRARSAGGELTDLEAVGRLCHRLDGLPLAIELAARRVHSMSVREIEWCLDDQLGLLSESARTAPDRHRNLRAAIDWSYLLLNPVEQQVLRRLAMFPGGLTLAAAERVCGVSGIEPVLTGLVSKSLVRKEGERFRMLEVIRRYGLEQLRAEHEQEQTTRLAARWLADVAEPLLVAAFISPSTHRGFDEEQDNLLTVFELLQDHPDEVDTRVLLAAALTRVWQQRGRRSAAGRLVRTVLDLHGDSVNAPIVMIAGSWLAMTQGEPREALRQAVSAVSAILPQQRPELLVRALKQLGWALSADGRTATSECVRRRVVALCERLDDPLALAHARQDLAWFLLCANDVAESRRLLAMALPVARRGQRPDELGSILHTAGAIELRGGDLHEAKKFFIEVLDVAPDDTHNRPYALEGLAMVAERQGDVQRAGKLFAAARTSRERYGVGATPTWRQWVAEAEARVPAADGPADETVLNYACAVPDVADLVRALLTPVERRVLDLIVGGNSNSQVARRLGISASTVTNHLDAVLAKVRLENRAQVVRWYAETRARCAR